MCICKGLPMVARISSYNTVSFEHPAHMSLLSIRSLLSSLTPSTMNHAPPNFVIGKLRLTDTVIRTQRPTQRKTHRCIHARSQGRLRIRNYFFVLSCCYLYFFSCACFGTHAKHNARRHSGPQQRRGCRLEEPTAFIQHLAMVSHFRAGQITWIQ